MLLVSDYDNTYEIHYDDNNLEEVFKLNYNAVKKYREEKNLFAIATGRHFDAIKRTIDEKKLEFDYLIVNNGAEVYDSNYNLLFAKSIDDESLTKIKLLNQLDIHYRNPLKSKIITSVNIYFSDKVKFDQVKKYIEKNIIDCKVEYKYPL